MGWKTSNPIRSVMLWAFMISKSVNYVAIHLVGSHRVGPNGIIAARPQVINTPNNRLIQNTILILDFFVVPL
jgi:hypothetical protein